MLRFLAPVLVMLPLLNGVPTEAATVPANDLLGTLESHRPIVKVEEGCGDGYFRDGHGRCLAWYGDGRPARPHEACPPYRHFVRWANHPGGFCKLND